MATHILAAWTFCAILGGLAVFQSALAAGAPWGRLAWGGQAARLPTSLRVGSVVSIALYAAFGWIILERASVVDWVAAVSVERIAAWVIVGYCALGILMNAISRSAPERFVMTPVALGLFVTSLLVARS